MTDLASITTASTRTNHNGWTCPSCEWLNTPSLRCCDACDAPRPSTVPHDRVPPATTAASTKVAAREMVDDAVLRVSKLQNLLVQLQQCEALSPTGSASASSAVPQAAPAERDEEACEATVATAAAEPAPVRQPTDTGERMEGWHDGCLLSLEYLPANHLVRMSAPQRCLIRRVSRDEWETIAGCPTLAEWAEAVPSLRKRALHEQRVMAWR